MSITVIDSAPELLTYSFRLVGCDRRRIRHREIALQFVEGNLHDAIHIVAEDGQRIAERPAMLDVRQWNQILGTQLRPLPPVCRQLESRQVKHSGHVVQGLAINRRFAAAYR